MAQMGPPPRARERFSFQKERRTFMVQLVLKWIFSPLTTNYEDYICLLINIQYFEYSTEIYLKVGQWYSPIIRPTLSNS